MSLGTIGAAALRNLDPETAHGLAIRALALGLGPRHRISDPRLATDLCGLKLPSPIGLAAGFDKNAQVPDAILAAGFGFAECGTVTPVAQAGNPRPRLFRLTQDRGVINRLGFNNQGLDPFAARLAARRGRGGVVGANIGANKDSADRTADYLTGLKRLHGLADYFTANVSSPNTPGLRALQVGEALEELLERLAQTRAVLPGARAPLFLKVAPDLSDPEIEGVVIAALKHGLDGLIVGNTTLSRPERLKSPFKSETGGLSGAPLMSLSTEVLRRFHAAAQGRLVLIGAGGVASGADAYAKIRAGASAVQLYSAMVYDGPGLAYRVASELAELLSADGFSSVGEAIGR